jgi:hypothetical protein
MVVVLLLFGVTYRYATASATGKQEVSNPLQVKIGVTLAFAITRALSSINVPSTCASVPLDCGPPLHYLTVDMIIQGVATGSLALAALAGAAAGIDYCFNNKLIRSN